MIRIVRKLKSFSICFFLCYLFFALLSCSVPPPNTPYAGLLESLESILNEEEKPDSIFEGFSYMRKSRGEDDLVTALYGDDRIALKDGPGSANENTLIYTIGDNRLRVHRDLFATTNRQGKIFFSLDGKQWFSIANDKKKNINNIDYDYPIETHFNKYKRELEIFFSWRVDKSDSAVPVSMRRKPLVTLDGGELFLSTLKKDDTLDLRNHFLFVPRGTELIYDITFTGNLINSIESHNVIDILVLRDFFIYTSDDSNLKLGISFNGIDWNNNIFSFRYVRDGQAKSHSSHLITYRWNLELNYNSDE